FGLTNQSPVRNEGPVNKQSASDQIPFRHRPPPAAVKTVVAVVAHRKIAVLGNLKRFRRIGHGQMPRTITSISVSPLHHSLETKAFHDLSIDEQLRRLDPQRVPRQTSQTFYVELSLIANIGNIFRAKNEYIAAMGLDEVVTKFVHEDLVTRIDHTAGDDLAASIADSRRYPKVGSQLLRRTINPVFFVPTDDPRPGEEKEKLLTLNLQDLVVYPRNHLEVAAPANDELGDLLENIWRLRRHRPPDNAVEGRLHLTGRNFERLQEIGTNTDRNDDRDQNYFTIFP